MDSWKYDPEKGWIRPKSDKPPKKQRAKKQRGRKGN